MRYRAAADALAATLTDGAVLLNLRTKRYYSLNETGTRIWELLLEGRTEEEIIGAMCGEFDVGEDVARREIAMVIAALRAQDLIVPDDAR
ncbi:MAG TPA: PqqD family protein [Gemmatimonadaceae bacterium]|nr:PqqD family protein [Gemmatimonadaceae bacterium]